ncbi:stromelysin-3 isoform X2 [Mesoplodon densirostris]|uniref:stromelysin-3 isoform X2 n=1 Tax=Mesoplodon densirostris TaxID=48708 RepID=UPI0028DBB78F|nr:stromelysin-3 isoform X2 [Mesoplodon densirostris]
MAWAARLRGAAPRALLLPLLLLLLLLLPPPPLLARAPRSPDAHRRHPVRRGPQPWREAPPSSPAPAPTAQKAPQPATGPRPPRCGVPDPLDGPSAHNRQKRFVLSGGRWEKTDLTYRILRFPWQLVREQARQTVAEALQVWSDVTPLTFTEVHEGHADIMIDFTRYWHGDNLPFDGPGGILAHAFFPKTHREGDVHFDYDETWTIGDNQGTDLLQVAAHEFGHVLGLQHTTAAKALMSPFYTFRYPLSLSPDDRRGIQHLYGRPRLAPTSRPPDLGPRAGVDTNEIAPLETPHQMPARSPLMRSPPSAANSSSSRQALYGGCAGAGCSPATLRWPRATGRGCPPPWMQPSRMPRATSGSSKELNTGYTMVRSQSWAPRPSLSWAYWGPWSTPPWSGAPRRTRSTSSEAETTGASTPAPAVWTAPCPAGPPTGEGCPLRSTLPSRMLTAMPTSCAAASTGSLTL